MVATLTVAFAGDPFNRWYLPEAQRYLEHFPAVASELLKPSIEAEACFVTENLEGVAMWYPPGVAPDETALGEIFGKAPPAELAEPLGEMLTAFERYHPHDDDCWYLPLIGVDPGHQGKGLGGALMKHVTHLIDAQGALSYLESSTPKNIGLYERHGFEVMTQLPFGDAGGVATPMLRERRET